MPQKFKQNQDCDKCRRQRTDDADDLCRADGTRKIELDHNGCKPDERDGIEATKYGADGGQYNENQCEHDLLIEKILDENCETLKRELSDASRAMSCANTETSREIFATTEETLSVAEISVIILFIAFSCFYESNSAMVLLIPISGTLATLWILWAFVFPKLGNGSAGFGFFLSVCFLIALFSCFYIVTDSNRIARRKLENAAEKRAAKTNTAPTPKFFDARD